MKVNTKSGQIALDKKEHETLDRAAGIHASLAKHASGTLQEAAETARQKAREVLAILDGRVAPDPK